MSSIIKSSYVVQTDKDNNIKSKEQLDKPSNQINKSKEQLNNLKEKILGEANKEHDRIIQEAREKADDIVKNAQKECDDSIAEAYNKSADIVEEFREKGYKEGLENGKKAADNLIEEAIEIKNEYFQQKDNLLKEIENDVITLVMDICEKVIGRTLAEDREAILSIITKGINSLNAKENLIIRVSPDDYDLVEMSKQKILAMGNLIEDIQVKPDHTLNAGGCIIETSKGSVDTSVSTQLEGINNLLKDLLNRE